MTCSIAELIGAIVMRHIILKLLTSVSLQATTIRSAILRALRSSATKCRDLLQDIVYAYPTIDALAMRLSQLALDDPLPLQSLELAHVHEMNVILDELSKDFPSHTPLRPLPEREVFLVTGTTGGLGALLLARLIAMPTVDRVYALNRVSHDKGLLLSERQATAFEAQGLSRALVDSPKVVLLEGDTALHGLGLDSAIFDEIEQTVTTIVHNGERYELIQNEIHPN